MAKSPKPLALVVHELASELFGPEWGGAVHRLTGRNRQSLFRLRCSALAGRDHPAAADILVALRAALKRADKAAAKALRPPRKPREKRLSGGGKPGPVKRYKPEEFPAVLKSRSPTRVREAGKTRKHA